MNRNNVEYFAHTPQIDIKRSKFDKTHTIKTSFNVGRLIPYDVIEVLPAHTVSIDTHKVVRMQPMVTAPMDDLYLDTYHFFVPNRLVWNNFKRFMGENTETAWADDVELTVPTITAPEGGFPAKSIADYMGLPTGVEGIEVQALPFRAFALIYNEWFRDQNLMNPVFVPTNDVDITGMQASDAHYDDYVNMVYNGACPKACKPHDYFTSCLPSPQKGATQEVNVLKDPRVHYFNDDDNPYNLQYVKPDLNHHEYVMTGITSSSLDRDKNYPLNSFIPGHTAPETYEHGQRAIVTGQATASTTLPTEMRQWNISNAYVMNDPFTINELRTAFQIQRMLEVEAISGTRYTEQMLAHFGVTSPDSRLQRPEYLGGSRTSIYVDQIVQNIGTQLEDSNGVVTSPSGSIKGYSLTNESNSDFTYSATEHGFIISCMVARYQNTYQQGIHKKWTRSNKYDYYFPLLSNLGEEPVYVKEIYATGTEHDDDVFGFQSRWSEYRYTPNVITSEMRSQYPTSLDSWHFADWYTGSPTLSADWIKVDEKNVDRCLTVSSTVSDQLFADIVVKQHDTMPMPLYSTPSGLHSHY